MKKMLISILTMFFILLAIIATPQVSFAQCGQDMIIYGPDLLTSGKIDFGRKIYKAGDVDNDGYPDILIGANGNGLTALGKVTAYSGITGDPIRTYYEDYNTIRGAGGFGYYDDDEYADIMVNGVIYSGLTGDTLANYIDVARYGISVGDLNNDGKYDLAVADPNYETTDGRVVVISGATGDTIWTWAGQVGKKGMFGWSVAVAGDVDNDGVNDIVIGEPKYDNGISSQDAGRISVYSGKEGYRLYSRVGPSAYQQFGYNVEGAGDLDNDGFDDILISGQNATSFSAIAVWVWSVKKKSLLYVVRGDDYKDEYGAAMDGIGDINQDGYDDFAVSAYRYDFSNTNQRNRGNLYIYSGIDGSLIQETYTVNVSPMEQFGTAVCGLGDLNGDGDPDFAVGAVWASKSGDPSNEYRGAVYIYNCPVPTDASDLIHSKLPNDFNLNQNFPNPFNPETTFEYNIPTRSNVLIEIFNISGQKVHTLLNETKAAGHYQISWDGNNANGEKVTSGVYFYRLNTGDYSNTRKMIMLK